MLLGTFEELMDFVFGSLKLFSQILVLLGQFKLLLFGKDFVLSKGLAGLFEKVFGLIQFLIIVLSEIGEGRLKRGLKFGEKMFNILCRIGFFFG